MGRGFGELEFDFQEGQGFVATGQVLNILRGHLARGAITEAADLYSKCKEDFGEELIADVKTSSAATRDSLARMFLQSRDYKRASDVYLASGNLIKAAELAEQNYELDRAADLFMQAGDQRRAAQLFEKNLDFEKAAKIYMSIKEYEKAGDNLERAERFLDAVKIFLKLRKMARAVDTLQKVGPKSGDYPQATILLGDILTKANQAKMAFQRYIALVKVMKCDENTIEVYYRLAKALAQNKMLDKAVPVMTKVIAADPAYKDAKGLVDAYKNGKTEAEPEGMNIFGDLVPQDAMDDIIPVQGVQKPMGETASVEELGPTDMSFGGVVTMMDGMEYLKKLNIFQDLSLDDMKSFYNQCEEKAYEHGSVIIDQGQPGEALHIIKKGQVDILKVNLDHSVVKLVTLPTGVCVGEMSMIDNEPTSARVVANGTVSALSITKQQFTDFLYSNDKVALRIYKSFVKILSDRLREANKKAAG